MCRSIVFLFGKRSEQKLVDRKSNKAYKLGFVCVYLYNLHISCKLFPAKWWWYFRYIYLRRRKRYVSRWSNCFFFSQMKRRAAFRHGADSFDLIYILMYTILYTNVYTKYYNSTYIYCVAAIVSRIQYSFDWSTHACASRIDTSYCYSEYSHRHRDWFISVCYH